MQLIKEDIETISFIGIFTDTSNYTEKLFLLIIQYFPETKGT